MKEEELNSRLPKLTREILRYLTEHPEATDTVQGILQWWLHQDESRYGTREVQQVLDLLVTKGWLKEAEIPAPKIYRMNERRLEEIKAFLNESRNI